MKYNRLAIAIILTMGYSIMVSICIIIVRSNHNSELLLTQIICRRLRSGQGIVSLGVGLSYDLLRFIPCSSICFISPCSLSTSGVPFQLFIIILSSFYLPKLSQYLMKVSTKLT